MSSQRRDSSNICKNCANKPNLCPTCPHNPSVRGFSGEIIIVPKSDYDYPWKGNIILTINVIPNLQIKMR